MKQALAAGLLLVFFQNCVTLLIHVTGTNRQLIYVPWTVVLLAVTCVWARRYAHLSRTDVGLSDGAWKHSALIGALAGLLLALPALLFLLFPFLLAGPARYREIQHLDIPGLASRLGVELPIATALAEEVLFRGILQALFKRSLSVTRAIVATNVVFALWHLVVNALSLQQNTVVVPLIPPAVTLLLGYVGSLVVVGVGGVILSILRERTDHLAGSIAAHWVAVAAMSTAVYVL